MLTGCYCIYTHVNRGGTSELTSVRASLDSHYIQLALPVYFHEKVHSLQYGEGEVTVRTGAGRKVSNES